MGLLGASKWASDGSESATTTPPPANTPKAPRNSRASAGKKENASKAPRNDRSAGEKKNKNANTVPEKKALASRITREDTTPAPTKHAETGTSQRLGNGIDHTYGNSNVCGFRPVPAQRIAKGEVKTAQATTLEAPDEHKVKDVATPAQTLSSSKKLEVSQPTPSPSTPLEHTNTPKPTPTPSSPATARDAPFRIPPQASLSDTDFFFLIGKLRGKEISVQDWNVAVQQVQNLSFGVPIGAPSEDVSVVDISETSNGTPNVKVVHDGAGGGVVETQVQEAVPVAVEEKAGDVEVEADMAAELKKMVEVDKDEEW